MLRSPDHRTSVDRQFPAAYPHSATLSIGPSDATCASCSNSFERSREAMRVRLPDETHRNHAALVGVENRRLSEPVLDVHDQMRNVVIVDPYDLSSCFDRQGRWRESEIVDTDLVRSKHETLARRLTPQHCVMGRRLECRRLSRERCIDDSECATAGNERHVGDAKYAFESFGLDLHRSWGWRSAWRGLWKRRRHRGVKRDVALDL